MSTVMYLYNVEKSSMFEVFSLIRGFYHEKHSSRRVTNHAFDNCSIQEDVNATDRDKRSEIFSFLRDDVGTAELQVLELDGNIYFRVLENSYLFMNHFKKQEWDITPVFYDTRSETEAEELEKLSDQIDNLITAGHYFIYPLVGETEWRKWYMEAWSNKRRSLRI